MTDIWISADYHTKRPIRKRVDKEDLKELILKARREKAPLKLENLDLSRLSLKKRRLGGTSFRNTALEDTDFTKARLRKTDFRDATLYGTIFKGASLKKANLSNLNLLGVDFSQANLSRANFSGTAFYRVNLFEANLSGAEGILDPIDWLKDNFERTDEGYIVYKAFSIGTAYVPPARWKIEEGSVISEVCNPDRSCDCGCGVNFATRGWCEMFQRLFARNQDYDLWVCLIEPDWLPGVVVPFNTNGKARCSRLRLLKKL